MKNIMTAAVVGAALVLAVPAQAAEGFNVLLGGFGWNLPACKEGRVLREVRSEKTGKLVWRCVPDQRQTAQVQPAPRR
jgi:hypothetical protein